MAKYKIKFSKNGQVLKRLEADTLDDCETLMNVESALSEFLRIEITNTEINKSRKYIGFYGRIAQVSI